ncbi:HNH endonuclease signature motif containing protein [Bradyrhizobium genosp. A]|uniref:HNH endonuclease signature motif containing protein n=1 Tax=Bradyrhizobium genosp. A TaxID=83626 RepID=UPI003CF906FF
MLTGSRLEQLLTYDPETGIFRWRGGHKRVRAGALAGTIDKDGYVIICIDQKLYRAHRLAWLWMTGEWPAEEIDHRDTVKSNNRFKNLREANDEQNAHNRPKRGFTFDNRRSAYVAQINVGGRHFHLGQFTTPDEATAAYNAAAEDLHGEFARTAQ